MSVKDNLIAARALIDTPEKWGKGEFSPHANCYCALGAIAMAVEGRPDTANWHRDTEAGQLDRVLARCLPEPFDDVPDFNDHPDTTHADIMALFDRAIAAA